MQVTGMYELHKYIPDIFLSFLHARACVVYIIYTFVCLFKGEYQTADSVAGFDNFTSLFSL
jgi:hypothetical protein